MSKVTKRAKGLVVSLAERILTPLSTKWLKAVNARSYSEKVFMKEGLLPIPDHYYQPMINPRKDLKKSPDENRSLPGIDFNDQEQLNLLSKFNYNLELLEYPVEEVQGQRFYYNNDWYEGGDAEILYSMIRHFKPKRIIEIGCGKSTLVIQNAVKRNTSEDDSYLCEHICIEPFEQPWLEELTSKIIRKKVEEIDVDFFRQLDRHDILFIDSSHMIRPQGDVLFEYLEILPILNPGVIVHIHDIFTPKDYPSEWIYKHLLWNEQYLLEAFLSLNPHYRIISALNYLATKYPEHFKAKCPVYAEHPRTPKAFWLIRNE